MLLKELSQYEFINELDNYSTPAALALYYLFEELRHDCNTPINFTDISREFVEYDLEDSKELEMFFQDYGHLTDNRDTEEIMEEIQDRTLVALNTPQHVVFSSEF